MIERKMDKLAKSLAGHDKDHVYVVVKEDDSNVYLADGKSRKLDSPIRKCDSGNATTAATVPSR